MEVELKKILSWVVISCENVICHVSLLNHYREETRKVGLFYQFVAQVSLSLSSLTLVMRTTALQGYLPYVLFISYIQVVFKGAFSHLLASSSVRSKQTLEQYAIFEEDILCLPSILPGNPDWFLVAQLDFLVVQLDSTSCYIEMQPVEVILKYSEKKHKILTTENQVTSYPTVLRSCPHNYITLMILISFSD